MKTLNLKIQAPSKQGVAAKTHSQVADNPHYWALNTDQ